MTQHTGYDPLHDLAGYRLDEVYMLEDGRVVTRDSWNSPMQGFDYKGAVFLDTTLGLLDNVEGRFIISTLGYKHFSPEVKLSYTRQKGKPVISSEEFDGVVERLRQKGYATEQFSLVAGVFHLNYEATRGKDDLHE